MSAKGEKPVAEESLDAERDYNTSIRAQLPLNGAASEIRATLKGQPNLGYASLALELKNNALIIYWKGNIPAATEQAIESVRGRGINISVLPAKYSLEELQIEIRHLVKWERENVEPAYRAHTWAPMHDGSGIWIYVLKRNPQVEERRNASGMIRSTVEAERAVLLGDW